MASAEAKASGWVTFSWIIFLVAGLVNCMYGAAALVRKEYFPAEGIVYDALQSHGWVWLIIGAVQVLTAFLLMSRMSFGRVLGIALACFSVIVWFYYMLYLPLAGIMLVTIYILVIYGLGAHGEDFA